MDAAGLEYRTVMTTGLEHGCDEAPAAAAAGETPVVMSGDGLIGQIGGALAGTGATDGRDPRRPRQRLRPRARDPRRPGRRRWRSLAGGATREIDVGEVNGRRFLCIASCGFDSDANRIANEAKLHPRAASSTPTPRCGRWSPGSRRRSRSRSTAGARSARGYSVAAANSRPTAAACSSPPTPSSTTACSTSVTTAKVGKLRFLRNLPKVFNGKHVEIARGHGLARAPRSLIEADRPFAVYADGEHLADLPATVRVLPRALRVIVPG